MKKCIVALACILTFISTGFSIEEAKANLQYLKGDANDSTLTEILPALKEMAKEDFATRFNFASKQLLEVVKQDDRTRNIVDVDALEQELHQRADMIFSNDTSGVKNVSFTDIPIPLLSKKSSDLIKVMDFVLWNPPLRDMLWHAPHSFRKSAPHLNFVPDLTLFWQKSQKTPVLNLNEQILAVIMFGIEKDLCTNPNARSYDIPVNTHLIFEFFTKFKNGDNVPEKKIAAYQKYLTKPQNNALSLQLLSLYLEHPTLYDFENYIYLLGQSLFLNLRASCLLPLINNKNNTLIPLLQSYLHKEIPLSVGDKNNINTFVETVMNKKMIDHGKTVLFKNICDKSITHQLQNPLINKFKQLEEKMEDENDEVSKNTGKIFKTFVKTMNSGCSCVLGIFLNHLSYQNITKMYKIVALKTK